MEQELLSMVQTYMEYTGETVSDNFVLLLIQRVIGDYKEQRNYPADMEENAIQEDVEAYFAKKAGYIATEVIPAMLGKVGAEGHSALIDNQVSRYWANEAFPVYLPDVVPFCGVH